MKRRNFVFSLVWMANALWLLRKGIGKPQLKVEPHCALCSKSFDQPGQLKLWKAPPPLEPVRGDVLRCTDAKGCQARMMSRLLEEQA